ncbi:MAG: DNA polymerase Y family protein [Verrucomicrobiales bacterium]|nr:DNA polymerase Y family protein [Verrucomicrobiales bacterium]MCP5558575.1 DNA polymerase Y family protein [Verrucomicrobiaceae bacterium]
MKQSFASRNWPSRSLGTNDSFPAKSIEKMFAALHIPNFPLQVVLRHQPDWALRPVALLDETFAASTQTAQRSKAPVLAFTDAARRAGVTPGMTATQAQARCPHIHLIYRDPAAERAAQSRLLDFAACHSPDFEDTAPGVVCMDWVNVRRLSQRAGNLLRTLLDETAMAGFDAHVALAPNPDLAVLAAHLADPILLLPTTPADVRDFLAPLPIASLQPSADQQSVLELWGIHTLGQLTALPRVDLARRLGKDGAELWDQASGTRRRLLRLVRPPAIFQQDISFDHPVENSAPLLILCRRFLESLCARLESHWIVAGSMTLRLDLEITSRTQPHEPRYLERELRIADPSRDVDLLHRLLQTSLDNLSLPAPVTGLSLSLSPTRAVSHQGLIFEGAIKDPNRFAETLAQLEATLGTESVGIPVPATTHRPDTFDLEPFDETPAQPSPGGNAPFKFQFTIGLPARSFRPPRQARVHIENGHPTKVDAGEIQGRILQDRGPWLLSGNWWEPESWSRREWDVQLTTGALCKLVYVGGDWLLEGVWA